MGQITDGLSYTVAVSEAGTYGPGTAWSASDNRQPQWIGSPDGNWCATLRHMHPHRVYGPNRTYPHSFNSGHPGGLHCLAGDGAVHFVNDKISMAVWVSLGTARRWNSGAWYGSPTGGAVHADYSEFGTAIQTDWKLEGSNYVEVQGQWDAK